MKKLILIAAALAALGGSAMSGNLTTVTEKATGPGVKIVDAELKLAVGHFGLYQAKLPQEVIASLSGDFDEDKFEYDFSFEPSGKRGDLYFNSSAQSHFHTDLQGEDNRWQIEFSPDAELRLNTDIGAAKADLDFGGLNLTELKLNVGAAEAQIDFSAPNKGTLNLFKISAGACDLKMNEIGNARFDRLDFEGGVGSFKLDFSGQFDYRAEAKITVGLGSIDIIIPSDVGVRLESEDNFLNSIKFSKRELRPVNDDENVFETDNFDTAKGQLVIKLEVGMGSANIRIR